MRVFLIFCAVLALQESGEQTLGTDVHRRIINGTDSPHRPFYVRIVITDTERKPATENFGGAIFNESFVITAAHIFAHSKYYSPAEHINAFTNKKPEKWFKCDTKWLELVFSGQLNFISTQVFIAVPQLDPNSKLGFKVTQIWHSTLVRTNSIDITKNKKSSWFNIFFK